MTSRSKFDDVRAKLLRFRRDYFCVRSSQTHSDDASRRTRPAVDLDEVAGPELSSLISAGAVEQSDAGRPIEMSDDGHGGRSSPGCVRRHRHSVPSRCCVSILESLDEEEDRDLATPDWLDNRRAINSAQFSSASVGEADEFLCESSGITSSFDHSSSTDPSRG